MTRSISILLILGMISSTALAKKPCIDSCNFRATSKSFLSIHPPFQSNSPEMISVFRNNRIHIREDRKLGAAKFILFGIMVNSLFTYMHVRIVLWHILLSLFSKKTP